MGADPMISHIPLTPLERELVQWAIDPMAEYWHEEQEQPELIMPRIDGTMLLLPGNEDVKHDLLYRLGEQLVDMTAGAVQTREITPQKGAAIRRAIDSACAKIRGRGVTKTGKGPRRLRMLFRISGR